MWVFIFVRVCAWLYSAPAQLALQSLPTRQLGGAGVHWKNWDFVHEAEERAVSEFFYFYFYFAQNIFTCHCQFVHHLCSSISGWLLRKNHYFWVSYVFVNRVNEMKSPTFRLWTYLAQKLHYCKVDWHLQYLQKVFTRLVFFTFCCYSLNLKWIKLIF